MFFLFSPCRVINNAVVLPEISLVYSNAVLCMSSGRVMVLVLNMLTQLPLTNCLQRRILRHYSGDHISRPSRILKEQFLRKNYMYVVFQDIQDIISQDKFFYSVQQLWIRFYCCWQTHVNSHTNLFNKYIMKNSCQDSNHTGIFSMVLF